MLPWRRDLPDSSERISFSDFCFAYFALFFVRVFSWYSAVWTVLLSKLTMRGISAGCLWLALSGTRSGLPPGVARIFWLAFAALFLAGSRREVPDKLRAVFYLLLGAFLAFKLVVCR